MKTIRDIKAENPAYANVPDDELAHAIWQKSYSDRVSWEDFTQKINLPAQMAAADTGPLEAAAVGAGKFFTDALSTVGLMDKPSQQERHVYDALAQEHPVATTVGEVAPTMLIPGAGPSAGAARMIGTEALIGGGLAALNPDQSITEGAAFGGAGGATGRVLARILGGQNPGAALPSGEHAAKVREAQELGYRLTPGEAMADTMPLRNTLRKTEDAVSGWSPMSGPFDALRSKNQDVSQRIAREALGLTGDGPLTDDVLTESADRIGSGIRGVFGDAPIQFDGQTLDELAALEDAVGPSITRNDKWQQFVDDALTIAQTGSIKPDDLQQLTSDLAGTARAAGRGDNTNFQLQRALYKMRGVFDDALERSAPDPESLARLRELRNQYRILKVLEAPGVVRAGEVNLPSARRKFKQVAGQRMRENTPLGRASQMGDYFKSTTPNSGSPTRAVAPMAGEMLGDAMQGDTGGAVLRAAGHVLPGVAGHGYLAGMSPNGLFSLPAWARASLSGGGSLPLPAGAGLLYPGLTQIGGRLGAAQAEDQ